MTIAEAAERLGVSRDTVEREIARRALGHIVIGRRRMVSEAALSSYQKARTVEARRPRA